MCFPRHTLEVGVPPIRWVCLADALARIHATPVRRLTQVDSEMSRPLVQAMLAENEARWRERMPVPSVAMEAAYCWMAERARGLNAPASLVHGDPGFQNMIVDNDRLQCLLDWEFAHPGDPAEVLRTVAQLSRGHAWADSWALPEAGGRRSPSNY